MNFLDHFFMAGGGLLFLSLIIFVLTDLRIIKRELLAADHKPQIASWYGEEHRGKIMANSKPFNPKALTCACWDYPLGTYLTVTHRKKFVVVQVTDRGPAKRLNRAIDLSRAAFRFLADPKLGLIEVQISRLP